MDMRLRHIAIGLMMLFCLNVFGQQQKTVPMTAQPQKTEIQALEETVLQLQAENRAMQKQLENLEKEVGLCREDVRAKEAAINEDQGHWLALLSIVIGAIVIVLGIGAPLLLNRKSEKYIEKMLDAANREAISAKEQAEKSEKALKDIQPQIDSVKDQVKSATNRAEQAKQAVADIKELNKHVISIEEKVNKDVIAAKQSAKEAKASQFFFQALSEKDPFKAIELCTKVIELKPDMVEAYINRGVLKSDVGDYEGAMKDYNKAIELDPKDATAYFNRGNLKDTLGDMNGALLDYDKAIALDSKYVSCFINRGCLKNDLGDNIGALKDLNKAIELNPTDITAYNNRAIVLMQMGELNKAIDTVNDALVLDGNDYRIWETKGVICMKMDNYKGAEFAFTKAILLNPKAKESIKNRAACYRKMAEMENDDMKKTDYLTKAMDDELRLSQ